MEPDTETPDTSPGFLLWRITLRWQRAVTAALKPLGLTHVQFVLLASVWWLDRHGQRPSQAELAGHAAIDVMMTSQVLRTLEARELVTRSADPTDARVKRLAPTPAGRELALRAVTVVEAADRDFFSRATDPGRLLDVLHDQQRRSALRDREHAPDGLAVGGGAGAPAVGQQGDQLQAAAALVVGGRAQLARQERSRVDDLHDHSVGGTAHP